MLLPQESQNLSWTLSPSVAKSFAMGATTWLSTPQFKKGDIGFIFKQEFKASQLFLDLEFITEKHEFNFQVDFPSELEVIILPYKQPLRIWKLFN